MEKVVVCMREGNRTSAKLKLANTLHTAQCTTGSFQRHQQSTEENNVILRHFHRNYLKANQISKSEWIKKVEYAYHL